MITLTPAQAAKLPRYHFASDADKLRALHAAFMDPFLRTYKDQHQYIVDHDTHLTLNTLTYGRKVPIMEDLEIKDEAAHDPLQ